MGKKEFIEELVEILEIEDGDINEETNLKELQEYDSLAVLSIIAFVDENFSKTLVTEQLNSITTVKSLMELIGLEHFA
jgi:acyl carrier protein